MYLYKVIPLFLTHNLLFATIDGYSNSLNPDQTTSNSAFDLDPRFLTAIQKDLGPPSLKKIGRYFKMKQTIYLADGNDNFRSRLSVKTSA